MENQQLSQKTEYISKRKLKEEARTRQQKAKKIKRTITWAILGILFAGGIVLGVKNLSGQGGAEQSGIPKMEISPIELDAGTISMAAGLFKTTYEIKNVGDGDLKISNMGTSCHCTTAVLEVGDKESPEFGMSGMSDNPLFWSQTISPGQTGYLKLTFDPAYHGPGGTGPVMRNVTFSTNDPKNKTAEVRLAADVIN